VKFSTIILKVSINQSVYSFKEQDKKALRAHNSSPKYNFFKNNKTQLLHIVRSMHTILVTYISYEQKGRHASMTA